MADDQQEHRPDDGEQGEQPAQHRHHAVVFDQGQAEEQDRPGGQQIVERDRQRQHQHIQRPGDQQQPSRHAVHRPFQARMDGIFEPLDVAAGADRGNPAACRAAGRAGRPGSGSDGTGRPGKNWTSSNSIGTPVTVDSHGDAGRDAVGHVERQRSRRRRSGPRRPSRNSSSVRSELAGAAEQPVERFAAGAKLSFIRPPAPAGGAPARGAAGRASCRRA